MRHPAERKVLDVLDSVSECLAKHRDAGEGRQRGRGYLYCLEGGKERERERENAFDGVGHSKRSDLGEEEKGNNNNNNNYYYHSHHLVSNRVQRNHRSELAPRCNIVLKHLSSLL